MQSGIRTHNLGYPRIGENRELKKATEAYWNNRINQEDLEHTAREIRATNWLKQRDAGIDLIPCNDFSFYDQMLDLSCLVGNIPARFAWDGASVGLDTQFAVARGARESTHDCGQCAGFASEMTKWFDTNYHYIVPELRPETRFKLSSTKILDELAEARDLGINAKPILIGPLTYLTLGKSTVPDFEPLSLMDSLLSVYEEVLSCLDSEWVQLDEPVLALDLTDAHRKALARAYHRLGEAAGSTKLLVATYFGELRENLSPLLNLPVHAFHFDAVRGEREVDRILTEFPSDKILSLGVVNGRNIWKTEQQHALHVLKKAQSRIGGDRLWIAPSCSLLHVPITTKYESGLPKDVLNTLAFADEKLEEVVTLREMLQSGKSAPAGQTASQSNPQLRERLAAVTPADCVRKSPFSERRKIQHAKLQLPLFPTTTIGSFPQTADVRAARAKWKKGELPLAGYEAYLKNLIRDCIEFQDAIGIDMPVHGEFERNDMVEYFGEQLEGFAFTANGWVQSYGSRCVKPPIIYRDVTRPKPMTTEWSAFARSLTSKPVKGMLTGPITILQWSFVREDESRESVARQIALAIRDEVLDLEKIGIAAIQIDEPALREGLPLRKADRAEYLGWAVKAFRLCSSGVRDETQIHTHMCYCEFNDIIEAIADLDADVITIETSRSNMELLHAFVDFRYPNEVGPGVYDIHSPRIPTVEEMTGLIEKAAAVIPPRNLWINPDCGLKTRSWAEVKPALENMTKAAQSLRERFKNSPVQ